MGGHKVSDKKNRKFIPSLTQKKTFPFGELPLTALYSYTIIEHHLFGKNFLSKGPHFFGLSLKLFVRGPAGGYFVGFKLQQATFSKGAMPPSRFLWASLCPHLEKNRLASIKAIVC